MKQFILGLALVIGLLSPAMAQEFVALPEGQTALNISATEQVDVEQDLLVGSLRIQYEEKDAKTVQDKINKAMTAAVELAKKYPSLMVETGQYYVHPDYRYIRNKDGRNEQVIDQWRGSQTLTIKSQAAEDVLTVAGKLQETDFMMNGLAYQLSPKKYEDVREGLMEQTIQKLQARAQRVAKAMGKNTVDIVEINVDAHNNSPRPVFARMAKMEMMSASADAAMAPPVAEAGESTVSLTVSARAILKP